MDDSLAAFVKLFLLVCLNFVMGVGLGVQITADGVYIDPLIAIVSGSIICITVTAVLRKITIEAQL